MSGGRQRYSLFWTRQPWYKSVNLEIFPTANQDHLTIANVDRYKQDMIKLYQRAGAAYVLRANPSICGARLDKK